VLDLKAHELADAQAFAGLEGKPPLETSSTVTSEACPSESITTAGRLRSTLGARFVIPGKRLMKGLLRTALAA